MIRNTIGELSRVCGVNIETIRYYERVGLLPAPARSANGYRRYDEATAEALSFIRRGRELGFTIDELSGLLDLSRHPRRSCAAADQMVRDHLVDVETRIRDLTRMREALLELSACSSHTAEHCRLVQALSQIPERAANIAAE